MRLPESEIFANLDVGYLPKGNTFVDPLPAYTEIFCQLLGGEDGILIFCFSGGKEWFQIIGNFLDDCTDDFRRDRYLYFHGFVPLCLSAIPTGVL